MTEYAGESGTRMTFRLLCLTLAGMSPRICAVDTLAEAVTHHHSPHFFLQYVLKIVRLRAIENCRIGSEN